MLRAELAGQQQTGSKAVTEFNIQPEYCREIRRDYYIGSSKFCGEGSVRPKTRRNELKTTEIRGPKGENLLTYFDPGSSR
jgi:hypothetical protein